MNNLDAYSIGFIKECYRQGLMEKQAAALLDSALAAGMNKEAGWGKILGKGLLWGAGLAGLGTAGYAAHRGLQESDSMVGRLYRRAFPGGMDLDRYEQSMLKYEPQKVNNNPYNISDWSRSGVYSTNPVTSNATNDAAVYQNRVTEANRRRELALRDKRDEYGNVSDADRKAIDEQFAKDKEQILKDYNKYSVSATNIAASKQNYHRAKAMSEAARREAHAARMMGEGPQYGMLAANPNNNYSWGGRLWEKAKGLARPIYSGLGFTNSESDMARLQSQFDEARQARMRMENAVPLQTVNKAKSIGDIYS